VSRPELYMREMHGRRTNDGLLPFKPISWHGFKDFNDLLRSCHPALSRPWSRDDQLTKV
jgi:hypothetical protein